MKKIIITLLLALLVFGGVTACGNNEIQGELPEYQYTYNREFVGEWDGDMTIDGVLSEERWQDKQYLEFSYKGMTVKATATLTEKGVYIGASAEDTDITYYGRFDMHNNTCFIIYVAKHDTTKYSSNNALRLEVDPYDMRSYNQNQFLGAAKVIGEPSSKNTVSLTAELFVEWKALGYSEAELAEGIPEKVKINPTYHYVNRYNDGSVTRGVVKPTNCEPTWMNSYVHFDKNGYINYDRPGATMGSGANGMSKSDGWDLSRLDEGIVTSVRNHPQTLFFKDIYSDNFVAETTLTPNYAINDTNPQIGLSVMKDRINYRTMFINFNSLKNGSVSFRLMTAYPDDGWYETAAVYSKKLVAGELLDGLQIKVVKNGTLLLYFIENEFVYSERLSYIEGNCSPALYSLGSSTTFTDFSARSMTEAETLAYLEDECEVFIVEKSGRINGGKVNTSVDAVAKGGDITLTIVPEDGCVLTSMKNYDEDIYEDVKNNINGNEYVLKNVQEGVNISATFTSITSDNTKTAKIKGKVISSLSTASDQKIVSSAQILIRDKNNPLINYTYGTSNEGAYTISFMPIEGEYTTADGVSVLASGVYELKITAPGYRDYIQEIVLNESTVERYPSTGGKTGKIKDISNNITLVARSIGGPAITGEFNYESSVEGWDLSNEESGTVIAHNSSNKIVWFSSGMGKQSIVEFDAENACLPGTEVAPGVGIVIGNKNTKLMALLFNGVVRINPELNWNNGTEYSNDSTYNMSVIGEKVRFKAVHDGETLAIFIHDYDKHGVGEYDLVFEKRYDELDALSAYGLVITQTKECNVIFSDCSVRSATEDATVISDIRALLYGRVSVTGNDNNKSTVTLSGVDGDGYIKKGETVQIKVVSDQTVHLEIDGKKFVVTGTKTINAKITSDTQIAVSYPENLFAVSGSITEVEGFNYGLTKTVITAIDGSGNEFVFDGVVSAGGAYTLNLANGEYEIIFSHPNYLNKKLENALTVNGSTTTAENAKFVSLMPLATVQVAGVNISGSTNEWTDNGDNSITSVTAKKAVGESKFFNLGVKEYAIETTFDKLKTDGDEKYPMVGLALQNKNGYALLVQDHASFNGQLSLYIVTTTGSYQAYNLGKCSYSGGQITLKMVNDDGRLYIFVNGILYKTIEDDGSIFVEGYLNSFVTVGLRSVGHITTFRDTKVIVDQQKVTEARCYSVTATQATGGTLAISKTDGTPLSFGSIPAKTAVRITATADSGKTLGSIIVNGEEIALTRTATGGYFDTELSSDLAIGAYFYEGVEVSGTVSASLTGGNIEDTVITVKTAENTVRFDGAVNADGTYSVILPTGSITINFYCEGYMLETATLTVSGETSGVNITYDKIAPKKSTTLSGYTVNGVNTATEWEKTADSVTSGTSGRETRYFAQTATKYTFEVTIDKYDSAKKPFAGVLVKSIAREFAIMMYRENASGTERIGFFIVDNTASSWSSGKWVVGVAANSTESCTIKVVNDGEKLTVYFNGTSVYASDGAYADDTVYNMRDIIGEENAIGFITTGAQTTFRNITYTVTQ